MRQNETRSRTSQPPTKFCVLCSQKCVLWFRSTTLRLFSLLFLTSKNNNWTSRFLSSLEIKAVGIHSLTLKFSVLLCSAQKPHCQGKKLHDASNFYSREEKNKFFVTFYLFGIKINSQNQFLIYFSYTSANGPWLQFLFIKEWTVELFILL